MLFKERWGENIEGLEVEKSAESRETEQPLFCWSEQIWMQIS